MDSFVDGLRREGSQGSVEEETEGASVGTAGDAQLPGIYLPLLPRYFQHPTTGGRKPSDFQKAKEDCLTYIQEALLQSQWQRAAELMEIWRIGTEIVHHHPRSNIEESTHFADQMKNLGVKRYLKVSLEHAFHLLCNGYVDEAYRNLVLAESWRYGEQTILQEKELKLIQGYKGLLDYFQWLKKKTEMLQLEDSGYAESSIQQEMHSFHRQAAVGLKEIIKIPGVWDPFVLCYVDLLEYYKEYEEAKEVLREYAYNSKFPPNPNAHVYFYQFLKRRGETRKAQIAALRVLHELVPSHELMLEFYDMLKKSKKSKNHRLCLKVIFEALDFTGWKDNVKAWSCLAKQIVEILQNSSKQFGWLKKEWDTRKDWWPAFHFSHYLAKSNWKENESLACEKVLVAGMLLGKDCKYFKYVIHQGSKAKKKFKMLKNFVKENGWVHLRLSDT
ncbi:TATA box-binding protein-associated factor RNA polymerase I subunit A isoform X2 [Heteronotia binoei]|uniref:TATA box-binding protein-associated factor RNA polymerase I subunit A isoform X2 n=1 Tax=Heteronotia binoei TaxID=13085 RepID=UPI00293068B8|nr:TATA box-binding protein-associated factor RNA polymerase I subunit A isoform X2 [Heteronotia binoei]XP_060102198.1 TATA box-binding protein-associated factor RNA polymerase I subunit A isoform X2 [Heteronotia binoei]XP_060102206.1 TATA box-binding protein-associated factor RNA polymerase I subunit A isoform X2 [Heteronotia binoei]